MVAFLKGVYRVFRFVRESVINLFFILFVLVCVAVLSNLPQPSSSSFQQGALQLNLDGYLADNHDEFDEFYRLVQSEVSGNSEPLKISTFDVVRAIAKAKQDERITGLVLDLGYFEGGDLPSLEFVGREILSFKQSGKPVIAVGEYYDQAQYFLASFADKIYLNRAGFVDLYGLSYSNLYFKSLFEKIEAVPHIFRVGTYKSAVEPFIRDDMSPEAKENAALWLNTKWQQTAARIAENRGIAPENVVPQQEDYLSQFRQANGDDAQFALNRGLVSELADGSAIRQALIKQFGEADDGSYRRIDFFSYAAELPDRFKVESNAKIAVVNIEGEIVFGESSENSAGSDTIVRLLREAEKDNNIKGVILRINSPGGSAVASELIRQQAEAVQKAGKPVVVSMGGMAASGGYWIAATSDKIIASPSSLTGSIGIFGLSVSFEQTAKKLGVTEDGIATSPLANQSALKALPPLQAELIQLSIERGYQRFLELVSQGRKMPVDTVDRIAQGQVWLGSQAQTHGLVDELGDFNTAYQQITELVNQQRQANGQPPLEYLKTEWLAEPQGSLLNRLTGSVRLQARALAADLFGFALPASVREPLGLLSQFNDPKQSYLYCLNCGEVK